MSAIKLGRCVHCLGSFPPEEMTEDHVPPSSWYSDTTSSSFNTGKYQAVQGAIEIWGE